MKKKVLSLLVALMAVFTISISASAAYYDGYFRTSGWDYVGHDYWYIDGNVKWGDIHYSSGGDYKITVQGHTTSTSGAYMKLYVYEDDGSSNRTLLKTFTFYPNGNDQSFIIDTRGLPDGSNDMAEIIVKYDSNYYSWGSTNVDYYD